MASDILFHISVRESKGHQFIFQIEWTEDKVCNFVSLVSFCYTFKSKIFCNTPTAEDGECSPFIGEGTGRSGAHGYQLLNCSNKFVYLLPAFGRNIHFQKFSNFVGQPCAFLLIPPVLHGGTVRDFANCWET